MKTLLLASAALAATLALGGSPAEARITTWQAVHGRLVPTNSESEAHGKFEMLVQRRGDHARERLKVQAWGMDVTRDGDGNLPSYRVFLVVADASFEADFGEAFLSARGRARLGFRSGASSFPDGVESLAQFAGGKVEIRLGSDVILAGDVPEFLGLDDDNEPGSGAAAGALGVVRLHATDAGGRAHGVLEALYVNRPRVEVEAIHVECLRLGRRGETFDVVAVDGSGGETTLGSMVARTRLGIGILHLSTRRGDTIPGGGVLALGGQRVEVRDADGVVLLVGRFPTLLSE